MRIAEYKYNHSDNGEAVIDMENPTIVELDEFTPAVCTKCVEEEVKQQVLSMMKEDEVSAIMGGYGVYAADQLSDDEISVYTLINHIRIPIRYFARTEI